MSPLVYIGGLISETFLSESTTEVLFQQEDSCFSGGTLSWPLRNRKEVVRQFLNRISEKWECGRVVRERPDTDVLFQQLRHRDLVVDTLLTCVKETVTSERKDVQSTTDTEELTQDRLTTQTLKSFPRMKSPLCDIAVTIFKRRESSFPSSLKPSLVFWKEPMASP